MATDTQDLALDPVRERFAQEYHATGNASEAYRRANPKSAKWKENSLNVQAHKWLREPKICLRLEQLQAEASTRHNITVDTITGMLLKDHAAAHERGQVGAAVSASMGLAKLHGFLVEKHTEIPNDDPASFTTAQLEAIVRGGMTDAKRREIEALKKPDDPRTGEEAMQASKPKPH